MTCNIQESELISIKKTWNFNAQKQENLINRCTWIKLQCKTKHQYNKAIWAAITKKKWGKIVKITKQDCSTTQEMGARRAHPNGWNYPNLGYNRRCNTKSPTLQFPYQSGAIGNSKTLLTATPLKSTRNC